MKAIWISMLSICVGGAVLGYVPKAGLVALAALIASTTTVAWSKAPQYRNFTPTAAALIFLALMMAAQDQWGVGSSANTLMFAGVAVMLVAAMVCAGSGMLSRPRKPNVS